MAERILYIVKGDSSYSDCRCITELRTANGTYTREDAHDLVLQTPGALYVETERLHANLVPVTRDGLKYVRTTPHDTTRDDLLEVESC